MKYKKKVCRISRIKYKVESGRPVCPPADLPALLRNVFQIFSLYVNFDFAVRVKVEWGDLPNCTSGSLALLLYHGLPSLIIKFCRSNICGSGETGPPAIRFAAERLIGPPRRGVPRAAFWEQPHILKYSGQRSSRAGKETCRVLSASRSTFLNIKALRYVKVSRILLLAILSREGTSTVLNSLPLPACYLRIRCDIE